MTLEIWRYKSASMNRDMKVGMNVGFKHDLIILRDHIWKVACNRGCAHMSELIVSWLKTEAVTALIQLRLTAAKATTEPK